MRSFTRPDRASSDSALSAVSVLSSLPNWLMKTGKDDPWGLRNSRAGPPDLTTLSAISVISRTGSTGSSITARSPRSRRRLMKSRKSLIRQVPDQPGPPSGRTWSSFASLREIEGEDHELRRHIHLTYQHVAIHLQPHWREVQDPFDPTLHCLGCHSLCSIRRYRYYCLLYTSDAADDLTRVDLGVRRIIKKKKLNKI